MINKSYLSGSFDNNKKVILIPYKKEQNIINLLLLYYIIRKKQIIGLMWNKKNQIVESLKELNIEVGMILKIISYDGLLVDLIDEMKIDVLVHWS